MNQTLKLRTDGRQERLHKVLATSGLGSRRKLEERILQGEVKLNGEAAELGSLVSPGDRVDLDGKTFVIRSATGRVGQVLMYHKPEGELTARTDPEGRPTVFESLPFLKGARWVAVGRLDFNSTGLVLLTNDGQWSRRLSLPDSKLLKRYRVRVEKALNEDHVEAFRRGLYFKYEGVTTRPAQLIMLSEFEAEVGLVEGRYHQIKRMFGQCDNRVLGIHRFAVGSLRLDAALAPGQSRELTPAELAALSQG